MKTKIKEPKYKIGDEVWKINRDLSIVQEIIVGYKKNDKDEINYELDVKFCNGISETELFTTKTKAEVKLMNFLDDLEYKIGDLVVFEYKEYSRKNKTIGRIIKIEYLGCPYDIKGSHEEHDNISDEDILLKVKNEFIENFGNLQESYKEFEEIEKELRDIISIIHKQHDQLEKELETSIKKQYSVWNWNKSKPIFKDRFTYERDNSW